ncbi:MAG TPA: prolipoprotein diacylglyceryl transferase family protein [Polyangia bacterium]|nr:prolipoprotein diacylglyceryl transferase family protein [Polyangia bacterium]
MRPIAVEWLIAHRLPGWLVPDYFALVALSTIAATAFALRRARADGAERSHQLRAAAIAYLAALAGGYLVEALRRVPAAIAARSLGPLAGAGRAAYGGLLCAMIGATIYLHAHRESIGAFFDRAAAGTGLVFAAVRTGCFLAGCDYGRVTASPLGVRFPPGSLAAIDHARRGWIQSGARSLPVHPTELYEAAVGLASAAIAWALLRRARRRDGRVFLAWLALYAAGRFAVELLRGDEARGVYFGLSTAQWISLALLAFVAIAGSCTARSRSASPVPSA